MYFLPQNGLQDLIAIIIIPSPNMGAIPKIETCT